MECWPFLAPRRVSSRLLRSARNVSSEGTGNSPADPLAWRASDQLAILHPLSVQNHSAAGDLLLMALRGVEQAAEELKVTPRRVRQMLVDGTLEGQRVGAVWVIDERALRFAAQRRRAAHRPWNPASAASVAAGSDHLQSRCGLGRRCPERAAA